MSALDDLLGNAGLASGAVEIKSATGTATMTDASPTALRLDKWGMRRGGELVKESTRIQETKLESEAVADCFGAAFEPEPELVEKCLDEQRHQFLSSLIEGEDYQQLHAVTAGDVCASEIAAVAFAEQFSGLRSKTEKQRKRNGGKADAKKECMGAKVAAARATGAAKKDVGDYQQACDACGLGDGNSGQKIDPKRAAAVFARMRNNETLRKIFEWAGRFKRVCQSKQRQKVGHGHDDTVGVTLGGEISRLVPAELATLVHPALGLDTLRRLVEGQAMVREYRGYEPVGKGPIVVCVDESGSMGGERIETAKGIALTLAWLARKQRRWCALVSYSGGTEGVVLALPPGKWDETTVMDWLEHFYGGGTTMDVPLVELPTVYWPSLVAQGMARGKTDILCITDAAVNVGAAMRDQFNAWKKAEQVKLQTIVIGSGHAGDLAAVSDSVYTVPALTADTDAVGKALSI